MRIEIQNMRIRGILCFPLSLCLLLLAAYWYASGPVNEIAFGRYIELCIATVVAGVYLLRQSQRQLIKVNLED